MILHSLRHSALAALTLAALALAACSSEAPSPAPDETKGDVTLRLKVAMGLDGDAGSRADLSDQDGYEDPAGDFEKVGTLRVIILRPDGKTVEANRMVRMDAQLMPIDDNLDFHVEANELKYVYLIANESALTLPEGISGYRTTGEWLDTFTKGKDYDDITTVLAGWTAGFDAITETQKSLFVAQGARLPLTEMFRVQTIKSLNDTGDKQHPEGAAPPSDGQIVIQVQEARLFLTRAAAKATFRFDFSDYPDNVSGVNVTAVRLNGLSQREFVFPNNTVYSPGKYTSQGEGYINVLENPDRYITSFASPSSNATVDFLFDNDAGFASVEMKKPEGVTATDKKLVVRGPIYFAESLSDQATGAYTVQVLLSDPTNPENNHWFEAKPLNDNILEFDGHQAISRNTHLYIDIKFTPAGITWQAIEAPYNTVTLDPVFGLDTDTPNQ